MIRIQLDKLLKQKGKTAYWLSKKAGIRYNNLSPLIKNKTIAIRFSNLEKICEALDCNISDVLEFIYQMN